MQTSVISLNNYCQLCKQACYLTINQQYIGVILNMKKLITFIFVLLAASRLPAYASDIDSLKQKLQVTSDSLKGPIYSQIADHYLRFDTVSSRRMKYYYQTEALSYTMLALHSFSGINDTLGLRTCFNNLSKVYRSQHKYSQAKWFILQSNTISRRRKDTLNIISSLIELSGIKADIKDYTLAMRDLNDALSLTQKNHSPQNESTVQVAYAGLYRRMKNFTKAAIAIKRHELIDDSLQRVETERLTKINTADSLQIKKQDSVIVKKKAYTFKYKKSLKLSSARRMASL